MEKKSTEERFIDALEELIRLWKRSLKADNARLSQEKARENGTHIGRPKVRDDEEIKRLRLEGLSIRQIAKRIGMSVHAVQEGLKS